MHIAGLMCADTFMMLYHSDLKDGTNTLEKEAIDKIAKLFVIEKEVNELSAGEKVKVRQEKSKPFIDDFFS